jgi:hypothetical protein
LPSGLNAPLLRSEPLYGRIKKGLLSNDDVKCHRSPASSWTRGPRTPARRAPTPRPCRAARPGCETEGGGGCASGLYRAGERFASGLYGEKGGGRDTRRPAGIGESASTQPLRRARPAAERGCSLSGVSAGAGVCGGPQWGGRDSAPQDQGHAGRQDPAGGPPPGRAAPARNPARTRTPPERGGAAPAPSGAHNP